MRRRWVRLAVLSAAVVTAGCNVLPYAAIVNGDTISQHDLNRQLACVSANHAFLQALSQQGKVLGDGSQTFDSQFAATVLSSMISNAEVSQQVQRLHLRVSRTDLQQAQGDVVSSLAQAGAGSQTGSASAAQGAAILASFPPSCQSQLVVEQAYVTALEAHLGGVDLGAAGVQRYYDAHRAQYQLSCVSQIQTATEGAARDVLARVYGGAAFADVARSASTDQASAGSGGALGCEPPGTFVTSVSQVIDVLAVGQVSQPVSVNGTWHVFVVTSRRPEPLSDVAAQIRQTVEQAHEASIARGLARLQGVSTVTVNPQYGTYVRTPDQSGVVPPQPPRPSLLPAAS